jgi:signal transduction histidine kinase
MRAAIVVTGVALLLVVLLNLSLQASRTQATAAIVAESPNLAPILQAQNRFELLLGITASLVFLGGLFVVTILETHKTAGAAFHLCRDLERIRDGLYGMQVRLRKGDNLRELETAFNDMSRSLAERSILEVEELEHAASVADRIESPLEASDLAKTLRDMADEQRRHSAGLGC